METNIFFLLSYSTSFYKTNILFHILLHLSKLNGIIKKLLPHHPPGVDILIRNEFLWVHIIQEPLEALTVEPLSELHTLRYVPVILALHEQNI